MEESRLVPGRACGTCMMCCKVPYVAELDKPAGVWCRHAAARRGCTIYAERPHSCRTFYCLWKQVESLGPEWKPDKAKFFVHLQENAVNLMVRVDPSFPDAWTRDPYYGRIKRWAIEGAERGRFVFVRIEPRMIVVLPDRDEDLGRVDPQDGIVVSRRPGPGRPIFDVTVTRAQLAEASGQ